MKLSYEQIGRTIDIFSERLATKLEEVGLSICVNKVCMYRDSASAIIQLKSTNKDDEIHAVINISELLAIDFNQFDYHLIINNIGNDVDVEYSINKVSDLAHTIYCAYDIIIISHKSDVYIQTINNVHRPEYPIITTESADVDKECILNSIKNGKMYGIDIIIDRKDN